MTYLEAIILGLVQGIAEFLPISSSGHLKLFEKLLGLPNVETDYILFDVLLHFGTLVAVLIVYHRVIADLLREALTMVHIRTPRAGETPDRPKRRMIALLIASLLPLFLILPVKDAMEKLGSSYLFIGIMLMITGLMLYMSDHFPKGEKTEKEMTLWDALLVGLAQALAGGKLLLDTFIYDHVRITAIPMVKTKPAIPGRVRTAPKETRTPKRRSTLQRRAMSAAIPAP